MQVNIGGVYAIGAINIGVNIGKLGIIGTIGRKLQQPKPPKIGIGVITGRGIIGIAHPVINGAGHIGSLGIPNI